MPLRPDGVIAIEDGTPWVRWIRPIIRGMHKAFCEDDDGTGWAAIVVHHLTHVRFPWGFTDIRTIPVRSPVIKVRFV